jgi:hypothetical protein
MQDRPRNSGWLAACALLVLSAVHAADAPRSVAGNTSPRKSLDLKPPDIRKLYTPEQISQMLSTTIDPDLEGVEVEGARENLIKESPPLWRRAPSWILPREDTAVQEKYAKPDATFPYYRPPAASPSPMAGEQRR